MNIGDISFSEKLKSLSFTNFKKFWNDGDFDKKTGLKAEKAARKFQITVPGKRKDEKGV
jgi:hypothetical protein